MTYTYLTRIISGLTSGEIGTEQVEAPIIFVIGGNTYFGTIETIVSTTSISLLASTNLPIADGTVTSIEVIDMSTHYCVQEDLEYRISRSTLAQLTNDTANSLVPDATVLNSILSNVDATIDSMAGQVYTVPFVTIPPIIKRIAIALACFEIMQRRPVNMAMPTGWIEAYKKAMQQLEDISNMLLRLPDTATVASSEADMVVGNTTRIDFSDENNQESHF
jgi:phage gp36-like protein